MDSIGRQPLAGRAFWYGAELARSGDWLRRVGLDPLTHTSGTWVAVLVLAFSAWHWARLERPEMGAGECTITLAAAALGNGEVDWWEAAPPDLVPVLAANPDIKVEKTDPLGSTTMLRFNHLHPPFDNVKMRQAVLAVTDQAEFMSALAGDPANWNLCASFFTCGTPMASETSRSFVKLASSMYP